MKHTPTPWIMSEKYHRYIYDSKKKITVAELHCEIGQPITVGEAEANAAFIVKAVNNHQKLVEALGDLMQANGPGTESCGHEFTCSCAFDKAKQLLEEIK